jgi:1-acyl-sn-glycerol-3-phosphate acyltransferase
MRANTRFPLPLRDLDFLTSKVLPVLRAAIRARYFTVEAAGLEHVPRRGAVIYACNHAGWFTLDTLLGALILADGVSLDRVPYGAVQDELLKTPWLGDFFSRVGGFPATWLRQPEALDPAMQAFAVYPEGTEGNCKPFWRAYQMASWRSGFLRLALARKAVIVPVAIVGGEECLPVAATVRFLKPLVGTILPLPLSLVPLPTTWKFIAHQAVSPDAVGGDAPVLDPEEWKQRMQNVAKKIRETVQQTLDRETSARPLVRLRKLLGHRVVEQPGRLLPPSGPHAPPTRSQSRNGSSGAVWP